MRNHVANGSGAVQLRLSSDDHRRHDWLLDEHTRRVGRQGVAQAREMLRRSAPAHREPSETR